MKNKFFTRKFELTPKFAHCGRSMVIIMSRKSGQKNGKAKVPIAKNTTGEAGVPGEWLYFFKEELTVRNLADTLWKHNYEVEIWEEAGVLEIRMKDGGNMDIEAAAIHPEDQITKTFAEEHNCRTVFLAAFRPQDFEDAKKIMQTLFADYGGIFCGDTGDFLPVVCME